MGRRIWFVGLPVALVALVGISTLTLKALQHEPGDPADPDQVADGAALYAWNCSRCHGRHLGGEFSWAFEGTDLSNEEVGAIVEKIDDIAPAHDERGSTSRLDDETLFKIVGEGPKEILQKPNSRMPGFSDRLDDEQIWAVIAFIKSHWQEPEIADATDEIEDY